MNVSIIQSNFTFGLNRKGCTRNKNYFDIGSSGGLSISLVYRQPYKIQFMIETVVFYNNIANVGANFRFMAINNGLYSLVMKNTISTYGKALIFSTDNYDCTVGAGMTLLQYYTTNDESEVIVENCTFVHNFAQQLGGGVLIAAGLDTSGHIKFNNCIIYNNTANHGSGMFLFAFDSSQPSFHFAGISFDSNKVPNKVDRYQSALLLANIENVTFEQIDIINHDTTGLVSYSSHLKFHKDSNVVNNSRS